MATSDAGVVVGAGTTRRDASTSTMTDVAEEIAMLSARMPVLEANLQQEMEAVSGAHASLVAVMKTTCRPCPAETDLGEERDLLCAQDDYYLEMLDLLEKQKEAAAKLRAHMDLASQAQSIRHALKRKAAATTTTTTGVPAGRRASPPATCSQTCM